MVPSRLPMGMDLVEFRHALEIGAPAKIVDDESFHACGFGGIHHRGLGAYPAGPHDADDCIVALKGGSQVIEGV